MVVFINDQNVAERSKLLLEQYEKSELNLFSLTLTLSTLARKSEKSVILLLKELSLS